MYSLAYNNFAKLSTCCKKNVHIKRSHISTSPSLYTDLYCSRDGPGRPPVSGFGRLSMAVREQSFNHESINLSPQRALAPDTGRMTG